jgi:hypothetical protein
MNLDQQQNRNEMMLGATDPSEGDISHAVRTRLAIITLLSGNLDMLYERLNDDKRRKMIQDIRTHTQILSDLLCDVLEVQ